MSIKAMKATPHKQLIDELMDCRIPKTEREHAAAREIERLRQAIEEAEKQEPVAWANLNELSEQINSVNCGTVYGLPYEAEGYQPLYTTPPQRKPLTDEMVKQMKENCTSMEMRGAFANGWLSAEAAHGIKENA